MAILFALTGLPPLAASLENIICSLQLDRGRAYPAIEQCAPALGTPLELETKSLASSTKGRCSTGLQWSPHSTAPSLYYYARIVRKMFREAGHLKKWIIVSTGDRAVLIPSVFRSLVEFSDANLERNCQSGRFSSTDNCRDSLRISQQKDAQLRKKPNDGHAVVKESNSLPPGSLFVVILVLSPSIDPTNSKNGVSFAFQPPRCVS